MTEFGRLAGYQSCPRWECGNLAYIPLSIGSIEKRGDGARLLDLGLSVGVTGSGFTRTRGPLCLRSGMQFSISSSPRCLYSYLPFSCLYSYPPISCQPTASTVMMNLHLLAGGLLVLVIYLVVRPIFRALTTSLRNVPGPFLARFTRFWELRAVLKHDFATYNIALHEKYGSCTVYVCGKYSLGIM
jgi:hypothetical protein